MGESINVDLIDCGHLIFGGHLVIIPIFYATDSNNNDFNKLLRQVNPAKTKKTLTCIWEGAADSGGEKSAYVCSDAGLTEQAEAASRCCVLPPGIHGGAALPVVHSVLGARRTPVLLPWCEHTFAAARDVALTTRAGVQGCGGGHHEGMRFAPPPPIGGTRPSVIASGANREDTLNSLIYAGNRLAARPNLETGLGNPPGEIVNQYCCALKIWAHAHGTMRVVTPRPLRTFQARAM